MSKTILLADDSLTIQKVVELTFADTDFEVVSASSGDELLERLPQANPDIVICDTIMPGSDGYLVCQRIKSEPTTLHIPVILLTGTFEPFDRDRALAAGCSEIITKPFEARRLVETVERLVSGEDVAAAPVAADADEGAVAPPDFGAVVPPPPQAAVQEAAAEFGTILAEPDADDVSPMEELPGEGLDFTSTGFAEMEEAAEEANTPSGQTPEHGLEYEPPGDDTPFADPESDAINTQSDAEIEFGEPEEENTQPLPEFDPDEDVFDDEPTAPFEAGEAPSYEDEETFVEMQSTETPEFVPETEDAEDFDSPEPEVTPVPDEAQEFEFGALAGEAVEETPSFSNEAESEPIEATDSVSQRPDEISKTAEFEDTGDAAEVEEIEEIGEEFEVVAEETEDIPVAQVTPPPDVASAPIETPAPSGELSDADVDRIARRVVELAADRLEQIAWEVIPDMAEIVVRERLRELETEVEQRHDATAN